MRARPVVGLALLGLASAVLGGLSVRPALRWAADAAEAKLRDDLAPRLERRLGGDLRFDQVDLAALGRFRLAGVTLRRDDGAVVRVDQVEGGWSPAAALFSGPSSALDWVAATGVQIEAPSAATPLGRPISGAAQQVRLDRQGEGWSVRSLAQVRLGDGPAASMVIAGDTQGGVDVRIPGQGLRVDPPGRLATLGAFALVRRVSAAPSPLRVVATELELRGLPGGVTAAVDSVAATRDQDGEAASVDLRGLAVELDLNAALDEDGGLSAWSRRLRGEDPTDPADSASTGAGAPFAGGAWRISAEGADVTVRRDDREHTLPPLDLLVTHDGVLEATLATRHGEPAVAGVSVAGAQVGGDAGVRLIPLADARRGLSVAFDAWIRGGSILHPKLAEGLLSGVDARALGLIRWQPTRDRLEVEVRDGTVGPARFGGRFVGRRLADPKRAKLALALDLPEQPCQGLINAVPEGGLTVLQGMRLEGRYRGGLELAVDMEDLEESIVLEGRGDPAQCTVVEDGEGLDLEALNEKSFVHTWPRSKGGKPLRVGPGAKGYVALGKLPRHVVRSMIVTEDGRFWRHPGVNLSLVRRALKINLTKRGFVYGGSTITQQLMKNLFLTRKKTLARKLEEALLSLAVERVVPKRRLMELYVNVIEFGPDIYGISKASRFYFAKSPKRLTPIEGAFLAAIKPKPIAGPRLARRGRFKGWWHHRLIEVMGWLEEGGYITPLQRARAFPYYPSFRGPVLSGHTPRPGQPSSKAKRAAAPRDPVPEPPTRATGGRLAAAILDRLPPPPP